MVPNDDLKINITIEGPIKEIYKVKSSDIKVVADLDGYALRAGENKIPVEITNYPQGVNIKNNEFLRVSVNLDRYVEKRFDIVDRTKVTVKEGFYKGVTNIVPKTVTVSGPEQYVNMISEVRTEGSFENVSSDVEKEVVLNAYDKIGKKVNYIQITPSTTSVNISISKGKMVNVKVPIRGVLQDNLKLKNITVKNNVEIFGDQDIIKDITSIETEPVDLSQVKATADLKLKLIIPEGVSISDGETSVEVSIEVEKNITRNLKISTEALNIPDSFKVKYDKSSMITVEGEESIINSINENTIKGAIDLSGIKEGESLIDYVVQGLPDNVQVKSKDPQKLLVEAEKK